MIDFAKDTFFLDAYEMANKLDYYTNNNLFIATSTAALEDLGENWPSKLDVVCNKLKVYKKAKIIPYRNCHEKDLKFQLGIDIETNQLKHLACAYWFDKTIKPDETVFVCGNFVTCVYANRVFGEDCIIWARDYNRPY